MLHLGHAELDETPEKVIFLKPECLKIRKEAVEKAIRLLRSKKVGVTTTVQHVHKLDRAIEVLR